MPGLDPTQATPPRGFDAIAYINEPRWREMSLGLHRIEMLLHELGDPQDQVPCVHVAGTNGKGSLCAYLESILRCSGYATGLFTSPFIERFEERIQVDGSMIGARDLARIAWQVKEAADAVESRCGEHPTEFELMFACAALFFAEKRCDIAVIECGLGGRLDATNCVVPLLSVITPVSLDHVAILGSTIEEIAGEKAGIIEPGVPVLSAPQELAAMTVIVDACESKGSELSVLDASSVEPLAIDRASMTRGFVFEGERFETSLLGAYQPMNASLAIMAARILPRSGFGPIGEGAIRDGIASAKWPGRFEVISMEGLPAIAIDGAHNPAGAKAFAGSLEELMVAMGKSYDDVVAVCGILADKDAAHVVEPLASKVDRWVVYAPDNPRALDPKSLAGTIGRARADAEVAPCPCDGASPSSACCIACAADAKEAMGLAIEKAGPEGVVAAFGSLYSISALRSALP